MPYLYNKVSISYYFLDLLKYLKDMSTFLEECLIIFLILYIYKKNNFIYNIVVKCWENIVAWFRAITLCKYKECVKTSTDNSLLGEFVLIV